ncbi:HSP20-like chaperone [Dactylonectria macrodidyma]|uniref:HSP20-like chaperone n=1 Tax=Dactylonectria macrodidyma TaxID=307937 RepID=A0A9P9FQZ8_9HYPO|nr:HSP20-like chaperone [Dactylonectria macrodidyma]
MSSHQQQPFSMPFWDFIQSLDPNQASGRGVDHNAPPPYPHFGAGFPFGGPGHHGVRPPPPPHGPHGAHHPPPPPHGPDSEWGPWFHGPMPNHWEPHGRRGRRGHHHRGGMNEGEPSGEEGWNSASDTERDVDQEKRDSTDTMPVDAPDPAEVAPEDAQTLPSRPHPRGRAGRWGGRCGRGGRGGRGRRGGFGGFFPRGGPGPHHGPGSHPPPFSGQGSPFDFSGFMRGWANHPLFQNIRDHAQRFQEAQSGEGNDAIDSFAPPVDIFDTERAFVLHVALPGAKKEDVGVNWDADRSVLNISGVVHRPGDEEFLNTMTSSERKVGVFDRNVTLPPPGADERDEVDGLGITAKMEDGVLVVTVPKAEKEWTEVRKVDIE